MEFPSNSKTTKPVERPKIEKVVTGDVVARPKSVTKRFRGVFFSGDFRGAAGSAIGDVLLPAFRNMLVDGSAKLVERMIYGESVTRRRPNYPGPRVSYDRMSSYSSPSRSARSAMLPDQPPYRAHERKKEAGDIILATRDEAETVLERLVDIIDKYEVASLSDLNDLVGLPSTYVDQKWGWTSLSNSDVRQIREGYLLELPPVDPI